MSDVRVLIVEDDPRIARLHRSFVERVPGYEVVGMATDLADAMVQAAALEPDLALLDLYLPDGSGLDLLASVRAAGQTFDVILITAAREPETLQAALRAGVFDYIIKPVLFERFAESLAKFAGFRGRLAEDAHLEQDEVDRLLRSGPNPAPAGGVAARTSDLPKGVDPLTLDKVRTVLAGAPADGLSAEAAAEQLGVSRSTARRYLEHLVQVGFLVPDLHYGTVGRPERRYRRAVD